MTATSRPVSATNNLINLAGVAGFIAVLAACHAYEWRGVTATMAAVGAYAAAILVLEVIFLRTPWRASVGLDFKKRNFSWPRYATRLAGMYGSFGFVALLYWLFPEYHGSYYNPYWEALRMALPWVMLLAIPYGALMESCLKEPQDGYYWFGRFLSTHWNGLPWRIVGQHMLGWLVKGFFLPLMFVSIVGNINYLSGMDLTAVTSNFFAFHSSAISLLYTLDLLAAVAGYVMTLRLLDTHIRSSDPTMFGWWICTICYQPFLSTYMRLYLAYNGSESNWQGWLADLPALQVVWGSIALVLLCCYMWSSINFGCRFSNLTHRGVITNGMYRFTKHPAYWCKNTFWWMAYVPFASNSDPGEALRFTLLLAGVSTVYFLRARTEERHMSRDPNYVAYALWMNDHGILRFLGKAIPALRYKAPAGWESFPPYNGIK